MSNMYNAKARRPLFIFLMGTLAFSLSSIPGHKNNEPSYSSISLASSEFASTCQNMQSQIEGGADTGNCEITPQSTTGDLANIEGQVRVTQVKGDHRDPSGNVVTGEVEWETTVNVLCSGAVCPEGIGSSVTTTSHLPLADFKSITAKAFEDFKANAVSMQAKIAQAKIDAAKQKQLEAKVLLCQVDETGQPIPANERMSCQLSKLDGMGDDQAADYFEKNMLPGIKQLVTSDNVGDQNKGMALLRQLDGSGLGGQFVNETIHDLAQYHQYKAQAIQMIPWEQRAAQLPLNDPGRMAVLQAVQYSQMQADNYFRSRGLAIGNETFNSDSNFDFNGDLSTNLTDLTGRLDQYYASVLQSHQNAINPMLPGMNTMNTFNPQLNALGTNNGVNTYATGAGQRVLPAVTLPRYTANH